MGSVPTVPSDLDKSNVTHMEEDANSSTAPSLPSPPIVEEMEEDDLVSKTMAPSSSPSRIEENVDIGSNSTSKVMGSSSSSSYPEMTEMEDDIAEHTTKATVTGMPSPSPPKNHDDTDHFCTDSVNVSDLPMEGPQEIEQEEEKGMEPPKKNQEDKLVTPSAPVNDDNDHTYSTTSSPSVQACSIVMGTSEHIPESSPESTIEVCTSTTDETHPSPPPPPSPPLKDVEDKEVVITNLQNEVTRLEAVLTLERSSRQEISSQLLQSQTQFTQLSNQLTEAASIIMEQQKVVNKVAEKEALLESLKKDLQKEREEKSAISQKYDKQQRSLVSLTKEFNEIFEELQIHFASCCKAKERNGMDQEDPSNMSWMSNQQLQNKLDQLTASVQERYQSWTNEQRKMEEELNGTRKTMEELIELLEGMEETTAPKEKSTVPPPPQKHEPSSPLSSPPNPPEEMEHGEDHSKNSSKNSKRWCICGREFFSLSSLRCHIKRLTGEQKYVCGECSKGFFYPSDLKTHKLYHKKFSPKATPKTKRTIWSCEFCNNSFLKADIYKIHIQTCRTTTAGTSTDDTSPPPISVASSSSTSNPHQEESSDDDITILEDDSTFTTPSISIPLRQPPNSSTSQSSSFPPVISRVAQLYMSSSPISILPTPPPAPLPPGIVEVVQHAPMTTTPSTATTTFTSKKHYRDITKRHIGFFCICGIKFISRKRLDGHLTFRNGRINGATSHRHFNLLTLAQIKKEKASSSLSSQPQSLGGNFKKNLNAISAKRGGGRPKSKKKHGVDPTNSLACLCGKSEKTVGGLLRHIRYHTATRTVPCEFCDKLFLTNSFLNRHYKTSHQVEMMTAATVNLSTSVKPSASKKIRKPKKTVPAPSSAAAVKSTPIVQVHRMDYSKSHRGNFCKCGRKFSSKRKLNIHLYRKNTEGDDDNGVGGSAAIEVEGLEDTEKLEDSWKKQVNSKSSPVKPAAVVVAVSGGNSTMFTCTTCGEKFTSNVDRIRHRVQAHGHGLF